LTKQTNETSRIECFSQSNNKQIDAVNVYILNIAKYFLFFVLHAVTMFFFLLW